MLPNSNDNLRHTVFAVGTTYETLFLARSIQGVSSACIGVSGMSLVAFQYPEEEQRSKVMGFVLGSIALGVLAGYPVGSVLYDLEGKMAPFLLVAALIVLLIGSYFTCASGTECFTLGWESIFLRDFSIGLTALVAFFYSSSATTILQN